MDAMEENNNKEIVKSSNKKKALITGINGFVGPYLKKELEHHDYEVFGIDLKGDDKKVFSCDITDPDSVYNTISKVEPDFIFHLAGFSSVGKSFQQPELCKKINVDGTRNLLDAVVKAGLMRSRILIVSSAEVYGKAEKIPIDENHPLNPLSPYGKSRVEQEKVASGFDLPIIIARSFNHTGPDQPDTFVIPSFRKQIKEANDGDTIHVGNLEVVRDFSDVRDVVKAYRILLEKGKDKEIYNVGSGEEYKLKDILDRFIKQSGKNLKVEIDPKRYRKADIPVLVCDNSRLNKLGATIRSFLERD